MTDKSTMRKKSQKRFHVKYARATTYPSEAFVYLVLGHSMACEIHKAYMAKGLVQLFGDGLLVCCRAIERRTEIYQRDWRVCERL